MSRNPPKLSITMLDPSLHSCLDAEALIHALDARRAWRAESGAKDRSFALVPKSTRSVLDLGSGTGDDALALAERLGPEVLVVGLDSRLELALEARRRARVVALNVCFAVGDARCLPFEQGAFDVVRADGLFQAVAEPRLVIHEIVRVLAPGGKLLIHDREAVLGDLLVPCTLAGLAAKIEDSFAWQEGSEERGVSLIATKPSDRAELVP